MRKAYGYIRVSSAGQAMEDKDGPVRQREAILKWAAANDVEIVEWFEDTITGKVEARPQLDAMMIALDSNGVKLVVFDRLDRLARKLTAQEGIIAKLQFHGYTVVSALEPDLIPEDDDDMESAMRVAMRQMLGVFAELERKSIVYKLRAARQRTRLKDPSRHEGRKPFGHRPGEADTVQRILKLHAKGESVRAICEKLTAEGRQTRSGGSWHQQQVVRILKRARVV